MFEIDANRAAIRIRPIFVREGWTWHGVGTPSVFEIAQTIRHLAEIAETHGTAETGRIRVEVEEYIGMRVLVVVADEFNAEAA